jgi:hypothetical protein
MPTDAATLDSKVTAIRGAVDNVGKERIYGWAWHPDRPEERLRVEARLGTRVVLSTRANLARSDLPSAGVGDGSHAFELRLTPECVARRHELFIVAVATDGTEATLPFRVPRTPAIVAAETRREADALAAARAALREELRAALSRPARTAELEDAAANLAAVAARIDGRLGALELWLTRLDGRLAAMAEPETRPVSRRDGWQVALGTILALVGGAGFAVSLMLLGPGLPQWLALGGLLGGAGQ